MTPKPNWKKKNKQTNLCHPLKTFSSALTQSGTSLCCCSVVQLCATLCDPRDYKMLGVPVSHHLPGFAQIYVYCISFSDTVFSFCPQSFPASGTFPMSHLFISDDWNTGVSASASVLPVNIQSWYPLRATVLFFLLSKEVSGVFSSTTVWRHQFFGTLPSLQSSSHNLMWPLGRP